MPTPPKPANHRLSVVGQAVSPAIGTLKGSSRLLRSKGNPLETLVRDFSFCTIRAGADDAGRSLHTATGSTTTGTRRAGSRKRTRAGRGAPRTQTPQSAEDIAEIAKLSDLPAWTSAAVNGDYTTGPGYPTAPELATRVGVPEGKVTEFVMNSADSKFYPGVNGGFQRHVCVYVPAEYVPGTAAPVIVSADAYGMRYNLPTILDNMIYDQRLPVMVAVMIDNGGAERSMEYDTVSDKYVQFVEEEVLPRAEKEANVKLSKNPDAKDDAGRQFRRCGGADHGLVPAGSLSPRPHVLGNIRQPAQQPGGSARRL